MVRLSFFTLLFVSTCFFSGYGQDEAAFIRKNLSYYYYPGSEIHLDHHVAKSGPSLFIYLKIRTLDGIGLKDNYAISYELRENYQSASALEADSISYGDLVYRNKNQFFFRLQVEPPQRASLMLIRLVNQHNQSEYVFDIPLRSEFMIPYSGLVIRKGGLPHFDPYLHEEDTIEIRAQGDTLAERVNEVFCYYYKTDFKAADPPMAEQSAKVQEKLQIDSVFSLPVGDRFVPGRQGLYFIQKDTNTVEGVSVLVTDLFYPRLTRIDDVIEPLIYITTRAEREKLVNPENRKAALDRFWLNLSGNTESAKNLIRRYYQRVNEANQYFTNYKEGWKTDMGMIYILFGPPDEMRRDEEKEQWIYRKIDDIPPLSFSFVKIKNIFAKNHYSLIRSNDYEKHWYRIVDLWRKGRFSGSELSN